MQLPVGGRIKQRRQRIVNTTTKVKPTQEKTTRSGKKTHGITQRKVKTVRNKHNQSEKKTGTSKRKAQALPSSPYV